MIQEILKELLSTKQFTILLIATLVTGIYAYTVGFFLGVIKRKKEEKKRRFFTALLEGLKTNTLESFEDLINIYKGIAGLSSEDLSYRVGLSAYLREFLVSLVSGEYEKSAPTENRILWKNKISSFINQNDQASPYADLPAVERSIISDIDSFLKIDDKDSISRKLNELASTIQVREDDFVKIKNTNKWSIPLAVVGLVLTIIFGSISLFR